MINKTLKILEEKHKFDLKNIFIEDVILGVFETGIKLSNNSYGLATTLINSYTYNYRIRRDTSKFTSGNIIGNSLYDLFYNSKSTDIVNTLKIASLNALSSNIITDGTYKMINNCDPFSQLNLEGEKYITIVGAFKTYIEKLSKTKHKISVLEFENEAIEKPYQHYFVDTKKANLILPKSDIIIITGFTLVNNTLEDLLDYIPKNCQVVVVGPSSSFIPDILFNNKVNIVGAIKLTKPKKALKLISEAASGFHLFKDCAEKICIVK